MKNKVERPVIVLDSSSDLRLFLFGHFVQGYNFWFHPHRNIEDSCIMVAKFDFENKQNDDVVYVKFSPAFWNVLDNSLIFSGDAFIKIGPVEDQKGVIAWSKL